MRRPVNVLRSLVALYAVLWSCAWAHAQSCHAPVLVAPRTLGLRGAVETAAASYDTARYRGEYQSVAGTLTYSVGPVQLYGRLPWYRISRNGVRESGLGDAAGAVRVRLLRDESGELHAGLALAGTVPTGSQRHDLGMGHGMITPGAFVAFQRGAYSGELLLSYGRALSHGGAHQHGAGGHAPIVNPMNVSEAQSALAVVRQVHPLLAVVVGAFAAAPIAARDGSPRAFGNAGVRLLHEWLDATFEVALPLVGDPFTLRLALGFGASF